LEELAINFERIGGEDDLDIAQIVAGIKPSKIKDGTLPRSQIASRITAEMLPPKSAPPQ
jgi:hypothetical protein